LHLIQKIAFSKECCPAFLTNRKTNIYQIQVRMLYQKYKEIKQIDYKLFYFLKFAFKKIKSKKQIR